MRHSPATRTVLAGFALIAAVLIGPFIARLAVETSGTPAPAAFVTPTARFTSARAASTATATPGATTAPTLAPSDTPGPSATWTSLPTATSTMIPVPEGMVLVPAGYFQMGSSSGLRNEAPEHPVMVDAYYLDVYEVSNADYQVCVDSQACHAARLSSSYTHEGYRDSPEFAAYPAIGVSWDDAHAYCQWAAKRLPAEAEWEYAASGPENFSWPWGNHFDLERSAASARDTQPVASFPESASPFGIHNMAGNVAEWVADVYRADYYEESPRVNPLAGGEGEFRLYRGGSFGNSDPLAYATSRRIAAPRAFYDVDIGFRCALDAPDALAAQSAEAREDIMAEFCVLYAAYRPDAACP